MQYLTVFGRADVCGRGPFRAARCATQWLKGLNGWEIKRSVEYVRFITVFAAASSDEKQIFPRVRFP